MLATTTAFLQFGGFALLASFFYVFCRVFYHSFLVVPFKLGHIKFVPYNSWFRGNLVQTTKYFPEVHLEWAKQYAGEDKVFGWRFVMNSPRICFTSPEAIRHILVKHCSNYVKTLESDIVLNSTLGPGLLTYEGGEHQYHRRLCQPAFSLNSTNNMVPIFNKRGQVLVDKWNESCAATSQFRCNVSKDIAHTTFDILGLAAFSRDFDLTSNSASSSVGECMCRCLTSALPLFYLIAIFGRWAPKLPIPLNWRRQVDQSTIKRFLLPIVEEKRVAAENRAQLQDDVNSSDTKKDLIDYLLDASMRDESGGARALTNDELVGHVMTFAFAGHETTATAIGWAVYVLAQRPDVENKIRDEVDTIMGERQEITLADVNQLRYVDAVVKEVLRLYPPIAQTVRSAVHDDVVCGVQIPAGVTLAIVPALLHRLPEYWERPDEFWPERWYDNTLRHNPAYIPFLIGPRSCIGQRMAVLEMITLLAKLVRFFSFTLQEGYTPTKLVRLTMKPVPEGPLVVVTRVAK